MQIAVTIISIYIQSDLFNLLDQIANIMALLEKDKDLRVFEIQQQGDSVRYLNELNMVSVRQLLAH